jgi:hypothetical protein
MCPSDMEARQSSLYEITIRVNTLKVKVKFTLSLRQTLVLKASSGVADLQNNSLAKGEIFIFS